MSLHTCEYTNEELFTSTTEEERLHECDVCIKQRFSESSHLAEHQRAPAINDKRYECDVCNERFSTSSGLSRHKRTHTGNKRPYKCDVCTRGRLFEACLT